MSKKQRSKVNRSQPPMDEAIETFTSIELEDKLERLKESRTKMLEEANRSIAQLDGAIAFISQLLAGELEDPDEEEID